MGTESSAGTAPDPKWSTRLRRVYRWWNQLRVVFAALVALCVVGAWELGTAAVILQALLFPAVAGATDLVLSYLRWRTVRFPWSGLVTGLFLALLIPPQGIVGPTSGATLLFAGAAMASLAILAKHLLRTGGRPWFNPAAFAMVAAGLLFGFAPAWWSAVSLPALLIAGGIVNARGWRRWALPLSFFVTYSALAVLHDVLLLGVVDSRLLLLSVVDPSVLFFTLFMVPEPRGSPADPFWFPVYGGVVGIVAVTLGFLIGHQGTLVGSDSLLLALLAGNLLAIPLRRLGRRELHDSASATGAPVPRTRGKRTGGSNLHWGWREQLGVSFAVFVLLVVAVSVAGPPPPMAGSTPPKVTVVSCTQDNRSISSSDLQMLHNRLGPSVVFSYSSTTGATVFYDPVNHVTVYETDLFEDYGSAEFNGDDSILAQGCSITGSGTGTGP